MEHSKITHLDVNQAEQIETHETADGPNMAELRSYLVQHGELLVESPRLPGVPLPLQALINACPKPPNEESAPAFLAEAQALVTGAKAKEQQPEPKDEDTEEEVDDDSNSATEESKKKLI